MFSISLKYVNNFDRKGEKKGNLTGKRIDSVISLLVEKISIVKWVCEDYSWKIKELWTKNKTW